MAPTDEKQPTPQAEPPRRRRRIFPYAWVGLLLGARIALQFTDVTNDWKALANMLGVMAGVAGLAIWYVFRGRARLPYRLAIGAAPFVLWIGLNTLYELRFNGAGEIVGLHRRSLAKEDQNLDQPAPTEQADTLADWGPGAYDYPRFLGTGPWAEAVGPPLASDWDKNPPEELWREEVGAAWSSFAVYGPYALTQEQRGDQELVTCYRKETGELVWSHGDTVRFDPEDFAGQMGRQGPRATPTIVGERVYTQGATGIVNCLDALTGKPVWTVDTAEKYGATVPVWGKSGSPLFAPGEGDAPDLVIVNVGAPAESTEGSYDASLAAFHAETGEPVWTSGWRQTSYASPALVTLHGERLVLQTSDDVLTAHRVADGSVAFTHPWTGQSNNMPSCSQPIELPGDQLLLTKGYGHGASLLGITHEGDSWAAAPLWDSPIKSVLQTKFCNAVVHGEYAYALNGEMLQCVEIATGEIAWRKRRRPKFGFGQLLLTGEHLLVQCEESGEVVLVAAIPERYQELAALRVLTEGEVCWNNPVVAGDLLLVRNAVEAAAYRLPLADGADGLVAR